MPGAALACGLATVDVVHVVESVPGPDEKVVARSTTVSAGGPACNASMTCAVLGVPTRFVGAVGSGPLSAVVLRDLAAHGVAVSDVAPAAFQPSLSTVLVTESSGERAVVSHNAVGLAGRHAEAPLSASAVDAVLDGVGAVLVDGHHLPLALAVAQGARRRGVPVLLDGGSWKPGLERLLALVDVAVVSAAFTPPDAGSDVLADVLALGPVWVARSDGPGPVRWRSSRGRSGSVEVEPVPVVDTLGAGDVLHGALLAALARTGLDDLAGALAGAVAAATRSVGAPGALGWAHPDR
ncbi:PfkB family carbohydrate kinase [Phycicoccus sonneratiae]|uniref:Carbohydrate kinase n=1 Tax=Phycicoccus sonneratiae TaxID=2807628 RepID=A0ABS2CG96_9MICO|nr:PfkB family carbohydrate kinase [Phycicoccus sonneraticus]MBM6398886.1 carbohydrate kinase [Phycicoccus sonneraticus]